MKKVLLFLLVCNVLTFMGMAEESVVSFGQRDTVYSKVLNENRDVFVSLPPGYNTSNMTFPVLYVLDGRGNFMFSSAVASFYYGRGIMPQMIVVAIPNTNRNRDFTPTVDKNRNASGGEDRFTEFLTTELIPYIDKKYKTNDFRILFGHSLTGMYSINTMLKTNDVFKGFIAASPYIMYDNHYTIRYLKSLEKKEFKNNTFLFMGLGDEPNYEKPISELKNVFEEKRYKNLNIDFVHLKNRNHATIPLDTLEMGLDFIFKNWTLPRDLTILGMEGLENHFEKISKMVGSDMKVTEASINALGYQYLGKNEIKKAIEAFKVNVKKFPDSSNVYDSLGEAYEKDGKLELALKYYSKAVEIAKKNKDANLSVFRNNVDRMNQKLSSLK